MAAQAKGAAMTRGILGGMGQGVAGAYGAMLWWQPRAVALVIGGTGAAVMLAASWGRSGPSPQDWELIACAGTGATLAGLGLAPLFGGEARRGLVCAVLGGVLATALGGMVAGLLFDMSGSGGWRAALLGAVMGLGLSLSSPPAFALWAVGMTLAHTLARRPPE